MKGLQIRMKRGEKMNNKKNTPKTKVQEQNKKNPLPEIDTIYRDKGAIYISNPELSEEEIKEKLAKAIDAVMDEYKDISCSYAIHLILFK